MVYTGSVILYDQSGMLLTGLGMLYTGRWLLIAYDLKGKKI